MKVWSQMVTFGALLGAVDDGPHHLEAGGVAEGVDDAAMAVAALAGQGELAVFLVELRAPADQVVDLVAALRGPPSRRRRGRTGRRRRSACPRCGSRSGPPATARRRCRPGRSCCCSAGCWSLVTTSTCRSAGTSRAARRPAMPPPMTSTSVNRCVVCLGPKRTRYAWETHNGLLSDGRRPRDLFMLIIHKPAGVWPGKPRESCRSWRTPETVRLYCCQGGPWQPESSEVFCWVLSLASALGCHSLAGKPPDCLTASCLRGSNRPSPFALQFQVTSWAAWQASG